MCIETKVLSQDSLLFDTNLSLYPEYWQSFDKDNMLSLIPTVVLVASVTEAALQFRASNPLRQMTFPVFKLTRLQLVIISMDLISVATRREHAT